MKPALLTLSFLLFAFPLAFSNDAQPVLDVDGDPVVAGREYYIRPVSYGVVTLGKTGNSTCPATVTVLSGIQPPGIPVTFSILGGDTDEIFTNTSLEITFPKTRLCVESGKWIVFGDKEIQKAYVGIGGPQDHPGQRALGGKFSILKADGASYSLAFAVPLVERPLWANIGRYYVIDPLLSLLALTEGKQSFAFGLTKAASYSGIRTVV